jgi:hypothetical protein
MEMREVIKNDKFKTFLLTICQRKITIKMSATKVNLSQLVDLAVVTPREGAVNSNVLHTLTLLHAMLRQLNIVDVQAETNLSDYDRDLLSASKARELSVLSDIDSGVGDNAEDAPTLELSIDSKRSSFMPTPRLRTGKRTPHHQVASIQEELCILYCTDGEFRASTNNSGDLS